MKKDKNAKGKTPPGHYRAVDSDIFQKEDDVNELEKFYQEEKQRQGASAPKPKPQPKTIGGL